MNKNMEILIADDNSLTSCFLKSVMKSNGYEKVDLTFGAEGVLECLGKKKYKLVVCQDILPEMTATELILRLKFNSTAANTKFLVLTSKHEEEYYLKQIPIDRVSYYTANPINFDTFEEKVEKLLLN
jgi:response regulator RpfG family c-di-GMP phosphodiesterase